MNSLIFDQFSFWASIRDRPGPLAQAINKFKAPFLNPLEPYPSVPKCQEFPI